MLQLIKNVKLCSPSETGLVDILIAGKQIQGIGTDLDYSIKGMQIVNADGKTAIPGYIDQHVHVTGGGGEGGFRNKVPELMLSSCVKGGVTTLVGLLGTDAVTRNVESLVAKVKELKAGGLTAYCLTGSYEYPSPTITGSIKKDIIFIEEIIGVKLAISDHRCSHVTREEFIRIASEARLGGVLAGKPGIVHLHVGAGNRKLDMVIDVVKNEDIPVSVFRPTHLGPKLEAALEFAELGGYIDFTTGIDIKTTAKTVVQALENVSNKELVTVSTDSNGSMPKWNEKRELIGMGVGEITTLHETIISMVQDCGLSLYDALKVATENVAKALELYPRKGVIKEGADADIVLLDKELSIDTVMACGQLMMQDKVVLQKGVFER